MLSLVGREIPRRPDRRQVDWRGRRRGAAAVWRCVHGADDADEDRPAGVSASGSGPNEAGGRRFHVLPPFAERELALTAEQRRNIETLEKDVQARIEKILTPEQQKKWNERRPLRGLQGEQPGQGRGDRSRRDQSRQDQPRRDGARGDAGRRDRPADAADRDDDDARSTGRPPEERHGPPSGL